MERFQLISTYSPWFIPLCLLTGALFAFALYQKKPIWSKKINIALAICRFVLVSVLCYLLLSPFLRQTKNSFEKPTVVLAVDNSQSVVFASDTNRLRKMMTQLQSLTQRLQDQDIN